MEVSSWAARHFNLDFIPHSVEEFRQHLIFHGFYHGEDIQDRNGEIWIMFFTTDCCCPGISPSLPYPWHDGNGYARVTQRGDGMYYRW